MICDPCDHVPHTRNAATSAVRGGIACELVWPCVSSSMCGMGVGYMLLSMSVCLVNSSCWCVMCAGHVAAPSRRRAPCLWCRVRMLSTCAYVCRRAQGSKAMPKTMFLVFCSIHACRTRGRRRPQASLSLCLTRRQTRSSSRCTGLSSSRQRGQQLGCSSS